MNKFSAKDIAHLKIALSLAKKGLGATFPNPVVGAVIVKNGKIIGQGYHHKAGLPHAEIEAIKSAKKSLERATLYVNLEPCSHFGKTPPCADAIVKAKIGRVVFCTLDPNPKVSGQGLKKLRAAGIKIAFGALKDEAQKLNEAFFTFQKKRRPFVTIKFASSLDGKIATRFFDSRWVTNPQARNFAGNLRGQYQAVLVGVNTVIHDNPNLASGLKNDPDPLRIILDSRLRIPLSSRVLRDNKVLIVTTKNADKIKFKRLAKLGMPMFICPGKSISLPTLTKELARREIISVFVEGGGEVLGSFVDANLVDKVYIFQAPIIIGGKNSVSAVGGQGVAKISQALRLKNIIRQNFGDNSLITGYISNQ